MLDGTAPSPPSKRFSFATNLLIILGAFCAVTAMAWPTVMSFDLWIFKDRSSFLNLDYLAFTKHYRIGIDICYSYGLLPVLLQHLALLPFGRGYKPMIGCNFLTLILNAVFWAMLLEELPAQRRWVLAVAALSPIVLIVNPNLPYSLASLSVLFAFVFILQNRLSLALAVSTIGCFCVPSLPLILAGMLTFFIILKWWRGPGRSVSGLASLILPGIFTYASLAVLLGLIFGFASVAATALPLTGARYYHEAGFSKPWVIMGFLHPPGYSNKYYVAYYLFSTATWFVLCAVFLFAFSLRSLQSVLRGKDLNPPQILILAFSVMLFIFMFFAYGPRGQHVLYEAALAAATLIGISVIPSTVVRDRAFAAFLLVGVLAGAGGVFKSLLGWRTTAPGPNTLGLYAGPGISDQWSHVLELSQNHRTLLLAYATGQHLYYPTIENADAWFLIPGLLYSGEEAATLQQIRDADIVLEDKTSPSPIFSGDAESELSRMHEVQSGGPFRILQRDSVH